jgi:hypothetical protein
MAASRSGPPVKTGACPCVADLVDYARGNSNSDDRQRIESHLQSTSCGYCRSWIAKATAHDAPSSDAPPLSAKWNRQAAFRDLERRLELLEDD